MERLADESPGTPVALPVRMLETVCGGTNLAYFMDTAPYSAKDVIDVYTIEKVTGFFVEFSRNEMEDLKKVFYVTFEEVAYKVYIRLDDIDFFDREKVEADWQVNFPQIQPGDLAISVHPTYLLDDIHDLFEAGFERAKWDLQLPEGTLFSVLNSVRIDDICFVKVLYRNRAMWAFGAMLKVEMLEAGQPNYHFI
jgi:hypothetical protein